jgi:hypothetical protein
LADEHEGRAESDGCRSVFSVFHTAVNATASGPFRWTNETPVAIGHLTSSLVTRVLQSGRRFSLSKSRFDNKVVAKDGLDDAALTAAKAGTVVPVPPEYLVPPQFSTSTLRLLDFPMDCDYEAYIDNVRFVGSREEVLRAAEVFIVRCRAARAKINEDVEGLSAAEVAESLLRQEGEWLGEQVG